jgi:histidyl-tRNA synthetase
VPYRAEARLVRGLDYYTRTLFEFSSASGSLGAQNALGGGGRYDAMVRELGGPNVPALGFALGLERILLAMAESDVPAPGPCFIAPLGARATSAGLVLARELRALGVATDFDGRGGSLKSLLRRANAVSARIVVLLGDDELDRAVVKLKNLAAHSEEEIPLVGAARTIHARLAQRGEHSAPVPANEDEEPR